MNWQIDSVLSVFTGSLEFSPEPFRRSWNACRFHSYMLAIGARPLWVAHQTGTSLAMIEEHYGDARCSSGELDALISDARRARTRNPRRRRDERRYRG